MRKANTGSALLGEPADRTSEGCRLPLVHKVNELLDGVDDDDDAPATIFSGHFIQLTREHVWLKALLTRNKGMNTSIVEQTALLRDAIPIIVGVEIIGIASDNVTGTYSFQ